MRWRLATAQRAGSRAAARGERCVLRRRALLADRLLLRHVSRSCGRTARTIPCRERLFGLARLRSGCCPRGSNCCYAAECAPGAPSTARPHRVAVHRCAAGRLPCAGGACAVAQHLACARLRRSMLRRGCTLSGRAPLARARRIGEITAHTTRRRWRELFSRSSRAQWPLGLLPRLL